MVTIRRLFIAGLVLVGAGCLLGCSTSEPNQGSLPPLPQSNDLRLQTISTGLDSPVFMTAPSGDATRLFIVQQGGLIRIFNVTSGLLLADPFLNISPLLLTGGERGLLGMAFDPQYASNRQFYVFYTNSDGDIVIARYLRSANPNLTDSSSATILLTVERSTFSNHNGGMLAFGPDGCLYAGVGDGGGGGDPNNNGQTIGTRLGKILRINSDTGGPCDNNNPFILFGGGGTASLEYRPQKPLAVLLRPPDRRPLHRRCRSGSTRGDQCLARSECRSRAELWLAIDGGVSLFQSH